MPIRIQCHEKRLDYVFEPTLLIKELALDQEPYMCLLDSAEPGQNKSQSCIIGLSSALVIKGYKTSIVFESLNANGAAIVNRLQQVFKENIESRDDNQFIVACPTKKDKFGVQSHARVIQQVIDSFSFSSEKDSEKLFLVGNFSYDLIELVEELPDAKTRSESPLFELMLLDKLAIIQQHSQTTRLVQFNPLVDSTSSHVDFSNIESAIQKIRYRSVSLSEQVTADGHYVSDLSDQQFADVVNQCKEHIAAGDVFQIVPSRRFYSRCDQPILAYQYLKQSNPGPYMFLLKLGSRFVLGSSPESALRYESGSRLTTIMPIAGTRKRYFNQDGTIDHEKDTRAEVDLRLSQKELAEHMMLVDLARNDLAKICSTGTRQVIQLMDIVKYSRVMHLVSQVQGELKGGLSAMDAYFATLNMGTLVGAPKISASKILRELESCSRDIFGGAIGYLRGDGSMDCAIAIRTAVVEPNSPNPSLSAYVQAGAGIVADSIAENEALETKAKASAVLAALHAAQRHSENAAVQELQHCKTPSPFANELSEAGA